MADAFFNTMQQHQLISNNWDKSRIKSSSYYRNNWGFTSLDSLNAEISIKCLKSGWPFKPKNEANKFNEQYVPINYIDSLAFQYQDYSIEQQHLILAEYYKSIGKDNMAFKEYYSLIKCYPYIFKLYIEAAKYLADLKKYKEAIELLQSSPNKHEDLYYEAIKDIKMKKNSDYPNT
jgi:tetratricopeptide (TPR) repeat protein